MAENKTPITLPEQADALETVLTGVVQATSQAADQHIEPEIPAQPVVAQVAQPAPAPGVPGPMGEVINTQ
ncbi:hypothetical protein C7C46_25900 [Streptomyces tateyamensis]|uniref:Uncharacterized protein n=1 Tax=Streptomyces tateyamensis TaxID=565073 RepID=A0A2V4MW17_9ACTN|nr:hypothetical protein [Streptomyces tateyamensis]PYC72078.1 hypothetical protein C7C46_25900 [Streptomyces tateyamensis]